VKLFAILCKKGICPLVARVLANMYILQEIQVKWNSYKSVFCKVTNGVKQGGVISPIMFVNYIDELFIRLKKLGIGCYVGNLFCGAFGYADDVILIAPTRQALKLLLIECKKWSTEYSLLFNESKSKYIICNKSSSNGHFDFDGMRLYNVQHEKHLGNWIGNDVNDVRIKHTTADFYRRFNVFNSHFKGSDIGTKYNLFKTYCMPIYGSQLWDYSSNKCDQFYVAWRKCIRRLFRVDVRTHNSLLNFICKDDSVDVQLHKRFWKFFQGAVSNKNVYISKCAELALDGSDSNVSKSLTYISQKYKLNKYAASNVSIPKCTQDEQCEMTAGVILDFIDMRDRRFICKADRTRVCEILVHLCTS
jgi:hypothetical protein